MDLRVLSAGAAFGLVDSLRDAFRARTGANIDGTFGAVGALRERLQAGERCDVVILTASMIADLERSGAVTIGSSTPLGRVGTGVAVRAGDARPGIADGTQLRSALLAAAAIYVPDTERSTAGIHIAGVLRRLGIFDDVAPRLSLHPNGATAMRALAEATATNALGCTQITEIRYTPGVALVGPLPVEFALSTVYSVALATGAGETDLARRFVELLAGGATRTLREQCGFE